MPTTQPANTAPPDGATSLSEIVKVRRRFLRSVSLERDFYTTAPLEGYIPTPSAIAALGRIAAGVRDPSARAVSLTGAYGTGKSACVHKVPRRKHPASMTPQLCYYVSKIGILQLRLSKNENPCPKNMA